MQFTQAEWRKAFRCGLSNGEQMSAASAPISFHACMLIASWSRSLMWVLWGPSRVPSMPSSHLLPLCSRLLVSERIHHLRALHSPDLSSRAEAVLEGRHTFTVETLMGRRDEPSLTVCARAMVEKLLNAGCSRLCFHLRPEIFGPFRWSLHRHQAVCCT